jgi:hypothetical protein
MVDLPLPHGSLAARGLPIDILLDRLRPRVREGFPRDDDLPMA